MGWGQVADGPAEEAAEQRQFLRGEACCHGLFRIPDMAADLLGTGVALFQQIDPLDPAVAVIGADLNEALGFHPAQNAGNGGVAQAEGRLQIPGAGRLLGMGQVADGVALGGGQVKLRQALVDGLLHEKMQLFEGMAQMFFRFDHSFVMGLCRTLHSLTVGGEKYNPHFEKFL